MPKFFKKLGMYIENRRLYIFIVGLLLIGLSVFGATRLSMAFGNDTFISPDSQVYRDYEKFTRHFSNDVVVVLLSGEDLSQILQLSNLQALENVENQIGAAPGVISIVDPAFFLKQALAVQTGTAALPQSEQMVMGIIVDPQSGEIRSQFRSVIPDEKHAIAAVTIDSALSMEEQQQLVEMIEQSVRSAGFNQVETLVTGMPVIKASILDLLSFNLLYMFLVAIGLMLLILALVFSVRGFFAWRWLPLGVVLIAIIYMFGAMGLLSIPITIVSMAVFPIVIGLGVDYAIQFHNRYDEEGSRGHSIGDAIVESVTHIGPAIGIAIIAACAGFAALFFSPVPMIKDFGYMLIIGVIACYLVSMFILLTLLYWRDRRHAAKKAAGGKQPPSGLPPVSRVENSLRKMAPRVIRNPAVILPIALVLTVAGLVSDSHIDTITEWSDYLSPNLKIIQDYKTLESVSGGSASVNLLVEAADITQPEVLSWITRLEQQLASEQADRVGSTSSVVDAMLQLTGGQLPPDSTQVKQILGSLPPAVTKNLVNADYTAANIVVNPRETGNRSIKELQETLAGYINTPPAGVNVTITGASLIQVALLDALSGNREQTTVIGIALVFAVLLLLFRFNIFKALMAIIPIGLIIGWSSGFMFITGIEYTPLTATLGTLIMGIGVEFTILLMMRYYEERGKNEAPLEAMTTALTRIGRAIIASGLTVIAGFGALLIAGDFVILRDFGIVTMMNVLFALISTLCVLPSLIVLIDSQLEKRRLTRLVKRRST